MLRDQIDYNQYIPHQRVGGKKAVLLSLSLLSLDESGRGRRETELVLFLIEEATPGCCREAFTPLCGIAMSD